MLSFSVIYKNLFRDTDARNKKKYYKQMKENVMRKIWTSELEYGRMGQECDRMGQSLVDLKNQLESIEDKKQKYDMSKKIEGTETFLSQLKKKMGEIDKEIFDHRTNLIFINDLIKKL